MTGTTNGKPLAPAPKTGPAAAQPGTAKKAAPHHRLRLVVITLPREMDAINAGQVHDTLAPALDGATAVLVADATGTAFCDCAGARALLRAHYRAAAAGTQLRLAASPVLRRILELTGAGQVLDTYPAVPDALARQPDHQQLPPHEPGYPAHHSHLSEQEDGARHGKTAWTESTTGG
jgi:anti-sigma B factor antagonist